jgi:hypothetical protein
MIAFAINKSSEYIKQRAEEADFQNYVGFYFIPHRLA